MTAQRPTRRQFLAGAASAALAGLAGCQASTASLDPRLPADRLAEAGWEQFETVDETATEEFEVAGTTQQVTVRTKADLYQNARPAERIADRFGVDADEAVFPAAVLIAGKARVDPPVTRLLGVSETALVQALDAAERQAKRELHAQGFRDVRRVSAGPLEVEAGPTARHRRYLADYPYEAFEVVYEGVPVTVEAGSFTLEAQLAVWPYRGLLATGAGIYPGEPGEFTARARGTTRTVELGLEPGRFRTDVRGLIRAIR